MYKSVCKNGQKYEIKYRKGKVSARRTIGFENAKPEVETAWVSSRKMGLRYVKREGIVKRLNVEIEVGGIVKDRAEDMKKDYAQRVKGANTPSAIAEVCKDIVREVSNTMGKALEVFYIMQEVRRNDAD